MAGNHPFATGPREALNAALMQGTAEIHREAERRPFMVAQFKGELPKEAYAAYLGRLWYVYDALEDTAEVIRHHPVAGPLYAPELFRREGLEKDMTGLLGPSWREAVPATPAARTYAERIREVTETFPPAWVAHQWLRYLGYVLGQDLIRGLLRKAYGPDVPVDFYAFPDIAEPKEYLRGYHARMNAMPLDDEGMARVVEEGGAGFGLQIDLTDELARDFGIGEVSQAETDKLMDDLKAQHG